MNIGSIEKMGRNVINICVWYFRKMFLQNLVNIAVEYF